MSDQRRNLLWRIIAAVVLLPPLIAAVCWQRIEALAAIIHVAVIIGAAEFFAMTLPEETKLTRAVAVILAAITSVTYFWWPTHFLPLSVGIFLTVIIFNLFVHRDAKAAVWAAAAMFFGIFYVGILLTTVGLLRRLPNGVAWVFLAMSITWFSDTGAYFAGRLWGKHKLYPAVSPGKTVEGAIAGLICSFLAVVLARSWYMPTLVWTDAVLLAVQGGALAQVGDLAESLIKRGCATKDSGQLIPGHGGLLDRIDGLLFAGPYIYLYATHIVG